MVPNNQSLTSPLPNKSIGDARVSDSTPAFFFQAIYPVSTLAPVYQSRGREAIVSGKDIKVRRPSELSDAFPERFYGGSAESKRFSSPHSFS